MYVCMYVCMYWEYVCTVCMYVCMYVQYVCTVHVCLHVFMYDQWRNHVGIRSENIILCTVPVDNRNYV